MLMAPLYHLFIQVWANVWMILKAMQTQTLFWIEVWRSSVTLMSWVAASHKKTIQSSKFTKTLQSKIWSPLDSAEHNTKALCPTTQFQTSPNPLSCTRFIQHKLNGNTKRNQKLRFLQKLARDLRKLEAKTWVQATILGTSKQSAVNAPKDIYGTKRKEKLSSKQFKRLRKRRKDQQTTQTPLRIKFQAIICWRQKRGLLWTKCLICQTNPPLQPTTSPIMTNQV